MDLSKEPQVYTINNWSPWMDKETNMPITDAHGNEKGSVVFEEHMNEQVDGTFKPPVAAGQKKYGVMEDYTTKSGSPRTKFTSKPKPQDGQRKRGQAPTQTQLPTTGSTNPYTDRQSRIEAEWAIGQAVQVGMATNTLDSGAIEAQAKIFYSMIDRVGSTQVVNQRQANTTAVNKTFGTTSTGNYRNNEPVHSVEDVPVNFDDLPY